MGRIVVAISGASGAVYGVRVLQTLGAVDSVETHLVLSQPAKTTINTELDISVDEVEALADHVHPFRDIAAPISSGSFRTDGMIVAPCSIKTLSAVANSYSGDLIARAADVTLKERRPLVLMVRETPFHLGHLRLMTQASEVGAVIYPPVPAFYNNPSRSTIWSITALVGPWNISVSTVTVSTAAVSSVGREARRRRFWRRIVGPAVFGPIPEGHVEPPRPCCGLLRRILRRQEGARSREVEACYRCAVSGELSLAAEQSGQGGACV